MQSPVTSLAILGVASPGWAKKFGGGIVAGLRLDDESLTELDTLSDHFKHLQELTVPVLHPMDSNADDTATLLASIPDRLPKLHKREGLRIHIACSKKI